MSIYITQGRYSQQAIKGMITQPEDREAQVKGLMKRAGGKLLAYYVTMGEYDWMTVTESSDPVGMLSALAVAGAGGGVSDVKTILAFTTAEAKEAMNRAGESASNFRSAGQTKA